MARIFSIDFYFQQKQYTALVTSGAAVNGSTRYTIAPNDELLKQLLPDGSISFSNLADLEPLAERRPRLYELAHSMAMALHLNSAPATG